MLKIVGTRHAPSVQNRHDFYRPDMNCKCTNKICFHNRFIKIYFMLHFLFAEEPKWL